jgi:hypothetical protein
VNHILIGLGGTGGGIIRSFRRLVYQEFRSNEPADVNLGYLYVDSDYTLMDPNHQDWKVLGRSVQLPIASQIRIKGDSLEGRLDNLPAYPGIGPVASGKTSSTASSVTCSEPKAPFGSVSLCVSNRSVS